MPIARWDQVPVFGFYFQGDDVTPVTGQVRLTLTQRVTRVDGRVIYPEGATIIRTIGQNSDTSAVRDQVRAAWRAADQAADGGSFDGAAWDARWTQLEAGAVFTSFPAADDPDIVEVGYQVKVDERLNSGQGKVYYIQPRLTDLPLGVNLGEVDVPPGTPTAPAPIYQKGQPGGVAPLDADGDVLNAAGVKVLPGGGGGGSVVDASTTVKGIVELATNTEAATGTDTVRVLTPANVKPLLDAKFTTADASTTVKGIVELATNTEAATGTDTVRAVTPAALKSVLDALPVGDSLGEAVTFTSGAWPARAPGQTLWIGPESAGQPSGIEIGDFVALIKGL